MMEAIESFGPGKLTSIKIKNTRRTVSLFRLQETWNSDARAVLYRENGNSGFPNWFGAFRSKVRADLHTRFF